MTPQGKKQKQKTKLQTFPVDHFQTIVFCITDFLKLCVQVCKLNITLLNMCNLHKVQNRNLTKINT